MLTVLREALDEANITPEQIDAVAYTKVRDRLGRSVAELVRF